MSTIDVGKAKNKQKNTTFPDPLAGRNGHVTQSSPIRHKYFHGTINFSFPPPHLGIQTRWLKLQQLPWEDEVAETRKTQESCGDAELDIIRPLN